MMYKVEPTSPETKPAPTMTLQTLPKATLRALPETDGSATYTTPSGYSILASINGPIEAQRRDELPEEAYLEVIVRPESGSGSPRDRHLELLLRRTLLPLIHTKVYPRALLQLTLQILRTPMSAASSAPPGQSDSIIPVLPQLLNAAVLAMLDAGISMRKIAMGVCVAQCNTNGEGTITVDPTPAQLSSATSLHALAYTMPSRGQASTSQEAADSIDDDEGHLLLSESSGSFAFSEYNACADAAQVRCGELVDWTRKVVQAHAQERERWRSVA